MGKIKSKKKSKSDAETRKNYVDEPTTSKRKKQRLTMSKKKEIHVLLAQGFKGPEIMKKLNLSRLPRQTLFDIKKMNFDNEVESRSYNSKHKTTDNQVMRNFENDVVELYRRKNKSGSFPKTFVQKACEEIFQLEKYKDESCLQNHIRNFFMQK